MEDNSKKVEVLENNTINNETKNNQPMYNQPMYNPPMNNGYGYMNNGYNIPEEYKPISMWGYFGYQLLFAIPCIGFILLCVFAFGGTRNINLRNYSRSYFCALIIGLIITVIAFIIIVALGVSIKDLNYR